MVQLFLDGGPVMWPLLGCLIISIVFITQRSIFWIVLSAKSDKKSVLDAMKKLKEGDLDSARTCLANSKDFYAKTMKEVLSYNPENFKSVVDINVSENVEKMRRFHNILDTIISVAPLLGILGTVMGIIISFQMIGSSGIQDPKAVTGGIGQALITTASGLSIAIFTLIGYNFFNAKIEKTTAELEGVLSQLELHYHNINKEKSSSKNVFSKKFKKRLAEDEKINEAH